MRSRGASIEEVLTFLRSAGVGKVKSVVALELLGIAKLGEGKLIVHNSAGWGDRKAVDEAFHDELLDAARDLDRKFR